MKKVPIKILLTPEAKAEFQRHADQRLMPLATWAVQAMLAYSKTARQFAKKQGVVEKWPSGWPKTTRCFHCKKNGHDPTEHGYSEAQIADELAVAGL